MDNNSPEKLTTEFIRNFVQQYWDDYEVVCYLSELGLRLKKEVPESKSFLSEGLRDFLRQNPIVTVIEHPGIKQKIGAIPLSVTPPEDITELFRRKTNESKSDAKPAYVQNFWDAFIKPIENSPRIICIEQDGNITVTDGVMTSKSDGCYEVTENDLTVKRQGGTIAEWVAATHKAIDAWLQKYTLPPKAFTSVGSLRKKQDVNGRLSSLLTAFEGMPQEDLARIKIPMDILINMISRK